MEDEKSLIWKEIKKSASAINKAGGNTIWLLLWSRGKSLMEVQRRIDIIISMESMDEVAKEEEEKLTLALAEQQRAEGSQYMS